MPVAVGVYETLAVVLPPAPSELVIEVWTFVAIAAKLPGILPGFISNKTGKLPAVAATPLLLTTAEKVAGLLIETVL